MSNYSDRDKEIFFHLLNNLKEGVEDKEEAIKIIAELRMFNEPIITVPEIYLNEILEKGAITEHETWIKGLRVIRGRIGTDPYQGMGENRVSFKILNHVKLIPIFTGADKKFHGTVQVDNPPLVLGRDVTQL